MFPLLPEWLLGPFPPPPQPPPPPAPAPINVPASIIYQPQPQPMQAPPPPSVSAVSTVQTVNVAQQAQVTPPPTPPAPSIASVHTTQTVYVRQVTVTTASAGAVAGVTAGAGGGGTSQLSAEAASRQRAGLAGGGAVGFAGGGRTFPRGAVLPGYSPGRDTIPAILSRGEAVLVPELVKQLGPGNIMAANYAASRRQPAALPMAAGGMSSRAPWPLTRSAGRHGSPDVVSELRSLRRDLTGVTEAMSSSRRPVQITVNDQSGDPVETARATRLALRMSSI